MREIYAEFKEIKQAINHAMIVAILAAFCGRDETVQYMFLAAGFKINQQFIAIL